jgi:hypothetical protein
MKADDLSMTESEFEATEQCGGPLQGAGTRMLLSMVASAGVGFLGGMLVGKAKGESRGLAMGIELGRLEAASAASEPPRWRRLWRRPAA